MDNKTGRGRLYALEPLKDFTNREIAIAAAWLDEYRFRVYDQIDDLPAEALNHQAQGTGLTIGRLVLHMAWAEALWMGRITDIQPTSSLSAAIAAGALDQLSGDPPASPQASVLIEICNSVRDGMTVPGLKTAEDAGKAVWKDGSTIRGILGQLQWHWVYHSGQIGLIRFEWGSDYTWTMGGPMIPPAI